MPPTSAFGTWIKLGGHRRCGSGASLMDTALCLWHGNRYVLHRPHQKASLAYPAGHEPVFASGMANAASSTQHMRDALAKQNRTIRVSQLQTPPATTDAPAAIAACSSAVKGRPEFHFQARPRKSDAGHHVSFSTHRAREVLYCLSCVRTRNARALFDRMHAPLCCAVIATGAPRHEQMSHC